MWNKLKLAITATLLLALTACAPRPIVKPLPEQTRQDLAEMEKLLAAQPDNEGLLAQLGDKYFLAWQNTNNEQYRQSALKHYRMLAGLNPGIAPVWRNIYILSIDDALNNRDDAQSRLEKLYAKHPAIKEAHVAPPSFVSALRLVLTRSGDEASVVRNIRNAIQADPKFAKSYELLAKIHEGNGRDELAFATLIQGAKNSGSPTFGPLLNDMTSAIMDKKRAYTGCYMGALTYIRQSLPYLQNWIKSEPDNADAHAALAKSYWRLGKLPLALHEAKRAEALNPSLDNAVLTNDILLQSGKLDEAKTKLLQLHKAAPKEVTPVESLATISLLQGNWRELLDYENTLIGMGEKNPYIHLRISLAKQFLGHDLEAAALLQNAQKKLDLSKWENLLFNVQLEKISPGELLQHASNACEKVEAHFYTGMRALLDKDADKARQHFSKISDFNVKVYTENAVALYQDTLIEKVRSGKTAH